MKILHVVSDFSFSGTGVTQVVRDLCWSSERFETIVFTTGNSDNLENIKVVQHKADLFKNSWFQYLSVKKGIKDCILNHDIDVIHIHGLWEPLQLIASKVGVEMDIPIIVTEHGMLSDWSWNKQGYLIKWKKNIYWKMLARKSFEKASVFHLQNILDKQHVQNLIPKVDLRVIPNGIKDEVIKTTEINKVEHRYDHTFLFLGRIHPKKGINFFIEAFAKARLSEKWKAIIVGPEEDTDYLKKLQVQIKDLDLEGRVKFKGPVHGQEKFKLLSKCWVGVVPSFSEGSSLVPFEYAACSLPSIVSIGTGLIEWNQGGGVIVDATDTDELANIFLDVAGWSNSLRCEKGKNARDFVKKRYSIKKIRRQWQKIYMNLKK